MDLRHRSRGRPLGHSTTGSYRHAPGGTVGGPWGVLAWTWPTGHGPFAVHYDVHLDGINSRIRCGDYVEIEGGPIRNPVSGAVATPSINLPQRIILKHGDLGASSRFRVSGDISDDHSGQYTGTGAFEYSEP